MPAAPALTSSFWLDRLRTEGLDPITPRPSLPGPTDADVVIVGAGYTGLWTALSLVERDPSIRVVVVEAEYAGFGASGRNGGWCSALLPMSWARMDRLGGPGAGAAMQRAMFATVDEVLAAAARYGIDAGATKGGWLHHATHPAHVGRLHAELTEARHHGFGEADFRWLERDEASARLAASGTLGSVFTPHCAALDPGALVRGLARAAEAAGVAIFEGTRVTGIEPGGVLTGSGRVRAEVVVRATEAYTARLPRLRRHVVPLYSLMVVTEPLDAAVWDELGWSGRETFSDARNLIIYAQRTLDGRIALGGRGAPYHYASRIDPSFDHDRNVHQGALPATLAALFPAAGGAAITHAWGGALAAPRDWTCSVGFDRTQGIAWAGGYVGDGVATSNLAGRTLADLIVGHDTDLTRLAWVGHRSRPWEPEPLRWVGINAGLRLADGADRYEAAHGRPSRWRQRAMGTLLGR